jgi:hypothetical protein
MKRLNSGGIMKGKIALIFVATTVLLLVLTSQVQAAPSLSIYGYPDKVQYHLGDSGSIKFWVFNSASDAATLKNVTIMYPWFIPGLGGNDTINNIGVTLTKNQNWSYTHSFTIPTDGRVSGSGSVQIRVYYEYSISNTLYSLTYSSSIGMNIAAAPLSMSVTELGMFQTLLIFNMVITLIGAFIIAAAIFMNKRGPPMT